jgi:predicted ferric reductase
VNKPDLPNTAMPRQRRSPAATPPRGTPLNRRLTRVVRRTTNRDLRGHRVRIRMLKVLWSLTFLALVFIPLALAPGAGEEMRPWSRGGLAIELCMTSGLLGLSTLAATMVLPSRVRSLTTTFGIEGVLRSHRWLALITTAVVLIHLGLVVVDRPANVFLLYPVTGPPRARAGLAATIALVLLCWLSTRRRKLRTRYAIWRWIHTMLAMTALIGTYLHMYWLNHLMKNAAERTTFLVIAVCVGAILINRWIGRPISSLFNAYVITEVRRETASASTLVLEPSRPNQRVMEFRPGQFAWIRLDSPFGPLQANPFTIASGIDNPRQLEFTIRIKGDFTAAVAHLTAGRKVYVDGPYGSFNDDHIGAESLLLIAAGVGITPMMSILRSHAFRRDRRRHCLVLSSRTPAELMFREELDKLGDELLLEVIELVSQPTWDWSGQVGRVDEDFLTGLVDRYGVDSHAFICGPPQMMHDVRSALVKLGVPAQHVHTEEFEMV